MTTAIRRNVRCAIYTRVSTESGLDQDFNSLDAQYDAAQAYIRSQAHAGWTLVRTRYDDAGFPTPEHFETSAMPSQDGLRLNHLGRTKKGRPEPNHPYEQHTITAAKAKARWRSP